MGGWFLPVASALVVVFPGVMQRCSCCRGNAEVQLLQGSAAGGAAWLGQLWGRGEFVESLRKWPCKCLYRNPAFVGF